MSGDQLPQIEYSFLHPPQETDASPKASVSNRLDVSGNKTVIEARQVEHIIKRHGENGTADKSMRDINDVGRIKYVLDNYDSVLESGRSEAYSTNKANGKRGTAKTVVFEKAVNGTYYVVEAVPDTAANTTHIVSAYMSKKGAKKAAPSSVTGKESPRATPKHARRVATGGTVSQIDADVNTSRECEESLPQSATLTAPSEV